MYKQIVIYICESVKLKLFYIIIKLKPEENFLFIFINLINNSRASIVQTCWTTSSCSPFFGLNLASSHPYTLSLQSSKVKFVDC